MSIFQIDMLPAREGDCLWIEYGDRARPRRILIDGGRQSAYATLKDRFTALPQDQREFELLILSHVDADHIEGLLKLVADETLPVKFKDVWFNGLRHLDRLQDFGPGQGEVFTQGINAKRWTWNGAFGGGSVVIPDSGALPVKTLADGMRLTLLSPTWDKLEKLKPVWTKELQKAGMIEETKLPADTDPPGLESFGALTVQDVEDYAASHFNGDASEANGSSICILAEFDGRRAALTGDGHAEVIAASLGELRFPNGDPVSVDAFKLSHHGSRGTHSVEVMRQITCKRFLISSDGSRHKHPHVESIARTLKHSGGDIEIICNYQSPETSAWDLASLKKRYGYQMVFPAPAEPGIARVAL
jgi:beta-lactamase superfamily II metal-dependent hydrolase